MATLASVYTALETLIEAATPLSQAGLAFRVVKDGRPDEAPRTSREVVIWSDGVTQVTSYLSATTWYVAHEVQLHLRYQHAPMRATVRAQMTEDVALLLGRVMRPVQLASVPWSSIEYIAQEWVEPDDEERTWSTAIAHLRIYQEVS